VEWNKTSCPDLSALSWIDEYMHLAKENNFANLKTLEILIVLSHKKQNKQDIETHLKATRMGDDPFWLEYFPINL